MSDKEIIERVRDNPAAFGLNGTYHSTAMFITGFNQACDGGLLRGFHEWMSVQKGELSSQHWHRRVLAQALPDLEFRGFSELNLEPEQEQQAVDHLLSLVLEFLEVRDGPWTLVSMYAQFHSLRASVHKHLQG